MENTEDRKRWSKILTIGVLSKEEKKQKNNDGYNSRIFCWNKILNNTLKEYTVYLRRGTYSNKIIGHYRKRKSFQHLGKNSK